MTSRGYHTSRHARRYGNGSNVNFRKHTGTALPTCDSDKEESVVGSNSYLADDENYPSFKAQLNRLGLVLRDITADGNCLFRALGDQLDGHSERHIQIRQDVCDYIVRHRKDFEPFMEDDIPFDDHLRSLRQLGTYGGNEVIVAFCRIHRVNVVIHQLGRDPWQICGTEDVRTGSTGSNRRQLHIAYHNGDHYSSVRAETDRSSGGSYIHIPFDVHNAHNSKVPQGRHVDHNAIGRLHRQFGGHFSIGEVTEALHDTGWNEDATKAYLLQLMETESIEINNSSCAGLWAPDGTGSRIFGGYTATQKTSVRPRRITKQVKKDRATERRRAERLGVGNSNQNDECIIKGVHAIQI